MDEGITVSELAELVSRANHGWPVEPEVVLRRLRHWTLAGLLPTVGETHGGSGRHRRYPEHAAFVAAILNSLAEAGHPLGLLTQVAESVLPLAEGRDSPTVGWQNVWKEAIEGRDLIYLLIVGMFRASPRHQVPPTKYAIVLHKPDGFETMATKFHGGSWVNLTVLFGNLQSPRGALPYP